MIVFPAMDKVEQAYDKIPVHFQKSLPNYILLINFIGAIILQKIGVSVGGTYLFFSFFLLAFTCFLGLVSKVLVVNPIASVLYLLAIGFIAMSQLFCNCNFSILAVLLIMTMHLPYIFRMRDGQSSSGVELSIFRKIMTILAIGGIAQYFLQFLFGPDVAFFIDFNIPKSIEMPGFNKLNNMEYGSEIYKSNGLVFLEPSVFSQFLAIAIIIEIIYFKSVWRTMLYFSGIMVTFSGTGLIILFICLPLYLIAKKRFFLLLFFCFSIISAPLWAPVVGLERTVERVTEFTSPKSSGYARFVSPIIYIQKDLVPNVGNFVFGAGAGSLPWSADLSKDFQVFNPTWGKLFYEYGLLASIFYAIFISYIFISSKAAFFLKLALFVQFLLLAEYLTPPIMHLLILSFLVWPSRDAMMKVKDSGYNLETKPSP